MLFARASRCFESEQCVKCTQSDNHAVSHKEIMTHTCFLQVLDGALFERRFDELRRKRDREDGGNGRPFSRMHKYYSLLAGERWAKVRTKTNMLLCCCLPNKSILALVLARFIFRCALFLLQSLSLLSCGEQTGARFQPKTSLVMRSKLGLQPVGVTQQMDQPMTYRAEAAPLVGLKPSFYCAEHVNQNHAVVFHYQFSKQFVVTPLAGSENCLMQLPVPQPATSLDDMPFYDSKDSIITDYQPPPPM